MLAAQLSLISFQMRLKLVDTPISVYRRLVSINRLFGVSFIHACCSQVVLKRISPAAIPTQTPQPDTSRSGKSAGTQASGVSASADSMNTGKKDAAAAAAAEYIAATAPDEADGWAPPMAADALLMRGRLALLDGKLRVRIVLACVGHISVG